MAIIDLVTFVNDLVTFLIDLVTHANLAPFAHRTWWATHILVEACSFLQERNLFIRNSLSSFLVTLFFLLGSKILLHGIRAVGGSMQKHKALTMLFQCFVNQLRSYGGVSLDQEFWEPLGGSNPAFHKPTLLETFLAKYSLKIEDLMWSLCFFVFFTLSQTFELSIILPITVQDFVHLGCFPTINTGTKQKYSKLGNRKFQRFRLTSSSSLHLQ